MATPDPAERTQLPRHLLRSARAATLATVDGAQPYAALVTPACLPDLSVLLLLSDLSHHTGHLRRNPLCSLLCMADPPTGASLLNPQTVPRVSLVCTAQPDTDPALRARYLQVHPYAAPYAGFTDFAIWRLSITRAHVVAGFAQAWTVEAPDLHPSPALVALLADASPGVLAHCNTDHANAMHAIGRAGSGLDAPWRLRAIDPDGCELATPDAAIRLAWPHPVHDTGTLREAIMVLTQRARGEGT